MGWRGWRGRRFDWAGLAAAVGLGLLLTGCDLIGLKGEAHRAIRSASVDGPSVRFRSETVAAQGSAVCGFFNGKNRMGAYVGFTPYVYVSGGFLKIPPNRRLGRSDLRMLLITPTGDLAWEDGYREIDDACSFENSWKRYCGFDYPVTQEGLCPAFRKGASAWREYAPPEY